MVRGGFQDWFRAGVSGEDLKDGIKGFRGCHWGMLEARVPMRKFDDDGALEMRWYPSHAH